MAAAAGIGYWGATAPLTSEASRSLVSAEGGEEPADRTRSSKSREDLVARLALVWSRPLLGPLVDPLPPPVVSPPEPTVVTPLVPREPTRTPLDVRLVGTILEAGRSMALLADSSGRIHLKRSGETIELPAGDTIEVGDILVDQVTVTRRGESVSLTLPPREGNE